MKKRILLITMIGMSLSMMAQNTFPTNGNVGIGTTNPSEKLQIENGVVKVRSIYNTDRFIWSRTDNTMKAGLAGDGARKMFFLADNSPRMTIDGQNGNVGIGTLSPDARLTVKGNIHAEEVKIDLNIPAPDYVFMKEYNLMSIEEVEKYIKEHSHLPEIQSAKEFDENGLMLAEMDMKLLKKIEELTLYIISQQKEINQLNAINEKLLELQNRLLILENNNHQ